MTANKNFEKSILTLEKIVEELEKGDLTLDDTLKKFEEGMKLAQFCQQKLKDAQLKISNLINEADNDK